jgi:hypothetical protein
MPEIFTIDVPSLLGTEDFEPDDLEEAIRMTLRGARDYGTWDCEWWDYAPRGWLAKVRNAPRELRQKVGLDLDAIDKMRREDEARCEATVVLLVDAMCADERQAALLIERIEEEYEEDTIPRQAVARYRKECAA